MKLPIKYEEFEIRVKEITLNMLKEYEKSMFLLAKNKMIFKFNKN